MIFAIAILYIYSSIRRKNVLSNSKLRGPISLSTFKKEKLAYKMKNEKKLLKILKHPNNIMVF